MSVLFILACVLVCVAAFAFGYHTGRDRAQLDNLLRQSRDQRRQADQNITDIRAAIHGNDITRGAPHDRDHRKPG
jgi:hypothetical protein